jgi:predicted PurR-regulated permease PerM
MHSLYVFADGEVLLVIENPVVRVPTVHLRGGSAIRRPLIVLAVCAVGVVCYLARDFLIPTAGAVLLALMLVPVANALERLRLPSTLAALTSVVLLVSVMAGLLAIAIPSISSWIEQAPYLTRTLESKLEGVRKSLAFMKEMSDRVEKAAEAATTTTGQATPPSEKVVVRDRSLLGTLASTTPGLVLQIGYAAVLAFMLLAQRNTHRRQLLRIAGTFSTRVQLARLMRDMNERVGHYLFSLAVIYFCVAVLSAGALALLGFPNVIVWGAVMGLASFVPFIGPPVVVGLVAIVGLLTFDDWPRIVAAPALLVVIHIVESQFVTPALVSRRCALNTVAVFVSIAFLGWMWGAIGAIVAVPLLILISTIAAHLPSLRWLEVLLSDDRPPPARMAVKPPLASPRGRSATRTAPPERQSRRRLVAAK